MADPLSVAASVVGLLAAGAKLASLLSKTASLVDAPSSAQAVLTEMREISAALQYLQQFLNGLMNVPAGRQQYILVEHLEGTLTGCVTTYDELEVFIDELKIDPSDMGVLDRFKWARKEKDVANIVQRLQNHKSSLNLMLTILQSTTTSEIHQSVVRLCNLLEQEVSRNDDLSLRLSRVERKHSDNATSRMPASIYSDEDDATIRPERDSDIITADSGDVGSFTFAFESDLICSRVYSRANFLQSDSHSQTSLTSSHRRNAAFAIFSSQSIDEISNLSIYTLPISIGELSNQAWYISVSARSSQTVSEKKIYIWVNGITSSRQILSISGNITGLELKQQYNDLYGGWGARHGVLLLHGRKIEDTRTLFEQGVRKEDVLVHIPKARWTSGDMIWDEKRNAPSLERFYGG
ncbi:hypothetical protein BKA64DRAFT_95164 [Cadophora sp. MPI-SDFR-AT-0126]|nr:hypothetical protein BKA64DRAFT_95164 [Leotiomycetes sp. MPI-SDFR-AT-0126]